MQGLDRYAYVNNSPVNFTDPSGHWKCDPDSGNACLPEGTKSTGSANIHIATPSNEPKEHPHGGGGKGGDNDELIWSSTEILQNYGLGSFLSNASAYFQYGAAIFSYLGALSEIGFTVAGLLGGSAAVGWIDLGFPIADVTGGLAGGLVGWEVGHGIHLLVTNNIETGLSNTSTFLTYVSDVLLGNTRLDVYKYHATIVVGQPSATSTVLAIAGARTTTGIADAAVDTIGSLYSAGKLGGGVYDLLGITGKSVPIPQLSPVQMGPVLHIQFGDG